MTRVHFPCRTSRFFFIFLLIVVIVYTLASPVVAFAAVKIDFMCGDANADAAVNVLDIIYLINHKFKDGPAPEPMISGDTNGDGIVNILDILALINYKFKGGAAPTCQ